MQKYRPKTLLAALSDRILRAAAAACAGMTWFVYLWGVSLPAVAAGLALGGILWLGVRQYSKRSTAKREKLMRQMIGGELAVDALLTEAPRKAAFQAALWTAARYPLVMHKALEWCVTGTRDEKNVMLRLIAQHPGQSICVQQLVECAREKKQRQMDEIIICLTAPASKDALLYAASCDPPMQIIQREELIRLAGFHHPATDDDLRKLARQKQTRHSAREWLAVILDASRARRYLGYGIGLSALALLTRLPAYPVPALVCLALYAGCRIREIRQRRHWQGQSTP